MYDLQGENQFHGKNGGAVLSTTIDKYIYISCRYLPPFFEHKYRIVWSHIEIVKELNQIKHRAVREMLKYFKIKNFYKGNITMKYASIEVIMLTQ